VEGWGTQFAKDVMHRTEGQGDFALDLIDLLQQKATTTTRKRRMTSAFR